MPRTTEPLKLSELQNSLIVGQSDHVRIQLFLVNRVIVQYTREKKLSTSLRPGQWRSFGITLRLVKRSMSGNSRCQVCCIAEQTDDSPRAAVNYPHKLGYWGRAARRKSHLRSASIELRKDWSRMVVESPLGFCDTVLFSDKSTFSVLSDSDWVWSWRPSSKVWRKKIEANNETHRKFCDRLRVGNLELKFCNGWGWEIWSNDRSKLVECERNIKSDKYLSIL